MYYTLSGRLLEPVRERQPLSTSEEGTLTVPAPLQGRKRVRVVPPVRCHSIASQASCPCSVAQEPAQLGSCQNGPSKQTRQAAGNVRGEKRLACRHRQVWGLRNGGTGVVRANQAPALKPRKIRHAYVTTGSSRQARVEAAIRHVGLPPLRGGWTNHTYSYMRFDRLFR